MRASRDVDAEFQLPDLHGIIADADVVHDTADRDLLAHRVQLRRRTGRVPTAGARAVVIRPAY